ncbi:MAG: methyl-accepting chemotaxis protein [Spirochaetes bacterium]|jgi:methyl-accepting chemotaxis protein|nr:methyl-accepting chemotaxis protein [Spirochaetota bacterium]
MLKPKKFIIRLTLRLEIYTNIIVVPLVAYFGVIGTGISGDKLISFLIAAATASAVAMLIGTATRVVKLSRILNMLEETEPDYYSIKLKLLSYPRTEGNIISMRWICGMAGFYLIYIFLVDIAPWENVPIALALVLALSVNYVISYFTTENMLSAYHYDPKIKSVYIPRDAYRMFSIYYRTLMVVFSVSIIPLIILGYYFFCANFQMIVFSNFTVHMLFVVGLSLATLFILVYESTAGMKLGLKSAVNTLESLEQGGLGVEPVPMLTKGEIGSISQYINKLSDSLRSYEDQNALLHTELVDLTKNLSESADSLSDSSKEQAASVEEVSATSEEISSSMENVAGLAVEQFGLLDKLTGRMADLSSIVAKSAGMIRSLLDMALDITSTANRGREILDSMLETMKSVSESSGKMTDIVGIINDISDKINLLSLNASIEAARAGEAGRGFAVVADEVSKLADMTANSIKDIDSLIRNNDNDIRKGMGNVESTVDTIGTIIELVTAISGKIDDIFGQIQKQQSINDVVNGEAGEIKGKSDIIRVSMEEHKMAIEEITKSIMHLNEMTQQNARSASILSDNTVLVDKLATGLMKRKTA